MLVSKLLYKVLPASGFLKIRQKFYTWRKKIHKPLSETAMKDVLQKKMGIKSGDVVFVHSSINFLNIDFKPSRLLSLLLELVGEEGTLLFPAWHFSYRAEDYLKKDLVFDLRKSPSAMGLLSELARRHKNALRSIHPTTSIVAIGRHAQEMTAEHADSIYPCGEKSPYYKMMKYHAKVIGLGVTSHFVSFLHCPEDVMKDQFPQKTRTDQVYEGKVRLADGEVAVVRTLAAYSGIGKRDIPGYFKRHISKEIFSTFQVKGNDFFVGDSMDLFNKVVDLAHSGITIYNG